MVRAVSALRLLPFLLILAAPASVWAQAEPAPSSYVPPGKSEPDPTTAPAPTPPPWHIAIDFRLVASLDEVSATLPRVGWGGGLNLSRAVFHRGPLRFGLGIDFAYNNIENSKQIVAPETGNSRHYLSHATIAPQIVMDSISGRLRPFLAVGFGLSVGHYYEAPRDLTMAKIVDDVDVLPMAQLQLGLDVAVWRTLEVGLVASLDLTFSNRTQTSPDDPMGTAYSIFSPGIFMLQLQCGFRF